MFDITIIVGYLLLLGDEKCSNLHMCANCICSTLNGGCELTEAMFTACSTLPVKGRVALSRPDFSTCKDDPICTNQCVQNYVMALKSEECSNSTANSEMSCRDFARLYYSKGNPATCHKKIARKFGRYVNDCCGKYLGVMG